MTALPSHPVIATDGGSLVRPAAAPFQAPYAMSSKAESTWQAYRRDWVQWDAWLAQRGVRTDDATPEHVAQWAAHLAQSCKASTVQRKISSLGALYRFTGRKSPTRDDHVRTTLAGIRRAHGVARKQAAPLTADLLRQLCTDLDPAHPAHARDAALLLLGFAAALRRSELVALDCADVVFVNGGAKVRIAKSKTDQEGEGTTIGVPTGATPATCPVAWLRRWVAVSGITQGALFRMVDAHGNVRCKRLAAQSVGVVVKRHAQRIGLDPRAYSAHSLRAGLATSAAGGGAQTLRIADHGRWRSISVLQGYVRSAQSLDAHNPVRATGL